MAGELEAEALARHAAASPISSVRPANGRAAGPGQRRCATPASVTSASSMRTACWQLTQRRAVPAAGWALGAGAAGRVCGGTT